MERRDFLIVQRCFSNGPDAHKKWCISVFTCSRKVRIIEANYFSDKAASYQSGAYVQTSASKVLLTLLHIHDNESVLDVGCGPGTITRHIASLTRNRVRGIDNAPGMIRVAKESSKGIANLDFAVRDLRDLDYDREFDVVYCNSAFQWFTAPDRVVQNFFRALTRSGRVGYELSRRLTHTG